MSSSIYAPPWRDVLPDGTLGKEYGPSSSTALAAQVARYRNWAYRKQGPERAEAPLVHRFFAECWETLPDSELLVYRLVYVLKMSLSEAAEEEGLVKGSVKSYVKRLRAKAVKWEAA
jgi:hypothetical protein